MANDKLQTAKKNKNDEFYTQFADIQKEMNAFNKIWKSQIFWNH